MKLRASLLFAAAASLPLVTWGQSGPPLAGVWNIAPTGDAASSGDLVFRVTRSDGSDPVEVTVPVHMGADQASIVRSIRSALSSQLGRNLYQVRMGEGGNVLVSDPRGRPDFALELVDSDVDNLRVAVQSVTPSASPTVPTQSVPAQTTPGTQLPSSSTPVPSGPAVPQPSVPVPNPTPPPNATPGSPPGTNPPAPPSATPGTPPGTNTPPPNATPGSPPGAPAPAPGTGAPAPGTNAPAPGTSAPAPGSSAPSPGSSAPSPGASAPSPGSSAPASGAGAGSSAPPPR